MATRYVSPTGLTPAGYDAYYTDFRAALAAVLSGDEVVLEKSTGHTWPRGAGNIILNNRSFIVRNEANDTDAESCCITLENNACLFYTGGASGNGFYPWSSANAARVNSTGLHVVFSGGGTATVDVLRRLI